MFVYTVCTADSADGPLSVSLPYTSHLVDPIGMRSYTLVAIPPLTSSLIYK